MDDKNRQEETVLLVTLLLGVGGMLGCVAVCFLGKDVFSARTKDLAFLFFCALEAIAFIVQTVFD